MQYAALNNYLEEYLSGMHLGKRSGGMKLAISTSYDLRKGKIGGFRAKNGN